MTFRKFLALLLIAFMAAQSPAAFATADDSVKVILNGEELVFDVGPRIIDGRTMAPMRKIFESLGASVEWDGGKRTVTATKGDTVVTMRIDSRIINVNGADILLDVPPLLIENRTLAPVRAVAEGFGADVRWDGATQTVFITAADSVNGDLSANEFSLLDDRMFIAMPAGTVNAPRQVSIMEPFRSGREETRLYYEKDGQILVLLANEPFYRASENIEDDVAQYINEMEKSGVFGLFGLFGVDKVEDIEYSRLPNEGVQAMQITSKASEPPDKTAILLKHIIAKTCDEMLVIMSIYVNAESYADKERCIMQADDILGTLRIGTRAIEAKAHGEKIQMENIVAHEAGDLEISVKSIEIQINDDFTIIQKNGYDFKIYYFNKIVRCSEYRPSMGIYIGGHPSGYKVPDFLVDKKTPDTILGRGVVWISYMQDNVFYMETIFNAPANNYMQTHIFMTAYDEKDFDAMLEMVRSMKFTD